MSDAAAAAPTGTEATTTTTTETTATPATSATGSFFGEPDPAPTPDATVQATETTGEKQSENGEVKTDEPPALKMPGKDATPEEWAAFYKQVGVPEQATDYAVALPEGDAPENTALIQEMFKKANILPDQAKALLEYRNEVYAKQAEAAAEAAKQAEAEMIARGKAEHTELMNEWGQNAQQNTEIMRRGLQQFGPQDVETQKTLIATMEHVLGPKETMKFFHRIGQAIGEHDAAGLGANNGQRPATKTAAEVLYGG